LTKEYSIYSYIKREEEEEEERKKGVKGERK
jgi:hypothetical protein